MSLQLYNKKRNFKKTIEPEGRVSKDSLLRFVVQRHHVTRIHYDFRLELNGTLKSWAVPKGPSLNPIIKRLAILVEDHPVSYISFEGVIPKGNYGAGTVEVWDNGNYTPVNEKGEAIDEKTAISNFKKGNLKFQLKGKKLKGEFALVRLKNDDGKSWLLIKHRDNHSVDTAYDSEDYSRNKKIENKNSTAVSSKESITSESTAKKKNDFIKPMLASVSAKAFDSVDWLYELKLDGYRAIAEVMKDEIKLYSRNGVSFLECYPVIAEALQKVKHTAILDGEIVVLDKYGKPTFQGLQQYEDHPDYSLVYYVFDLLELNGADTKQLELIKRKELLKQLLRNNEVLRYCDHINAKGVEFYKKVIAENLEGIVAKLKTSLYHPGIRSKQWLKIKGVQTQEAVIAGYTAPKSSRQYFGALILSQYAGDKLQYIGHTGTGFTSKLLKEIFTLLQPLITKKSPFSNVIKVNAPVTWVKPKVVVEVKFAEMTEDKFMRHPVFIKLRPDKDAKEAIMEKKTISRKKVNSATAKTESRKAAVPSKNKSPFTNLDKIFWPKEGYTKGDVINYYDTVSKFILPYLKNRPLSLKRNPNGILDEGFYHKDAGADAPAWVKKEKIYSASSDKDIQYIVCNDKATLLYLANLGCIEFNPWNSTTTELEKPTYIVIDIDPADKNTFDQVIETALVVKSILDKAGAVCFCKTSGATGLHIYVPMGNKYEYEMCRQFAHIVATLSQEQLPQFTSLERSLKKRGNSIYIDYLQNRTGQTLAAAYSLRPRPGATVSTPLEWKEVKRGLHPTDFTITNIHKRIEKKVDLFTGSLSRGINLSNCLKKLGA